MNRNLYRLIFNVARGMLMAVKETTARHSRKNGTRRTQSHRNSKKQPASRITTLDAVYATAYLAWPRNLLGATLLACILPPVAQAQIVADSNAPGNQRPTILKTNDGNPLVNIQTPSEGGVSRNIYRQFDIQTKGVVLNNQRGSNPWLAKGEARVILNEVRSSNPSYLGGPLSVQGGSAEVVIANPSGITVDGATFINMNRTTLTTGTPVMENGRLESLHVVGGNVNITPKGMNAPEVSYTEILARAVKISGEVRASSSGTLSITTGTQTVGYADSTLESAKGDGNNPAVAIDTAALGGMYAGRILLLATEEGVGVRNAGKLAAHATHGQLIVTSNGRLVNTGVMDAAITSVATLNENLDNAGTMQGQQLLIASSGNDLNLDGKGLIQRATQPVSVILHTKRNLDLRTGAAIESLGSTTIKNIVTRGQISLSAGRTITMAAGSQVQASGEVRLNSESAMNLTQATLSSKAEDVIAISTADITANKFQATGNTVHLETGAPFKETTANIQVTGGSLRGNVQTNLIATGKLLIDGNGNNNQMPIDSQGGLYMQADENLEITAGTRIQAQGALTVQANADLILHGSNGSNGSKSVHITGQEFVALHGNGVRLQGSLVEAKNSLTLSADKNNVDIQSLPNKGDWLHTRLLAGNNLTVSAYTSTITARGLSTESDNLGILATGSVELTPMRLTEKEPASAKNMLQARKNVNIGSLEKDLVVIGTDIFTNGRVGLHGAGLVNVSETLIRAGKNLALTSAKANGTSLRVMNSTLDAGGLLSVSSAGGQNNRISNLTAGAISFYADKGKLDLDQMTLSTKPSSLSSLGKIAGQINIESGGTITVDAGARQPPNSKFSAHTDLTILAGSGDIALIPEGASLTGTGLRLHASQLLAGRDLNIATRRGALTLKGIAGSQGIASAKTVALSANGAMTLGGVAVDIQGATIKSGANLDITAYQGNLLIDGIRNNFSAYKPAHRIKSIQENIDLLKAKQVAIENDPKYRELTQSVEKFWRDLGPACWHWYRYGDDICRAPPLHKLDPVLAKLSLLERQLASLQTEKKELERTLPILDNVAKGYEHVGGQLSAQAIRLTSGKGIAIHGANIRGAKSVVISASGSLPPETDSATAEQRKPVSIYISGLSDVYEYGAPGDKKYAWAVASTPTRIGGDKGVAIEAAGNDAQARLVVNDTEITSTAGNIHLQSLSDMRLESGQEELYSYSQRKYRTGNWFKRRRVTETRITQDASASPVILSGNRITLEAGGNLHAEATAFSAPQGAISITAANALSLYAVPEASYDRLDVQKKSSILGVSTGKRKSITTRETASQLPTTLVASSAQTNSGWDTLLQGTIFETALKGADIRVGVGAKARADARIILEGIKRRVTETQTKEGNYVVWQRSLNVGGMSEVLALPMFSGPTPPSFLGPVLADIPDGDFKRELNALVKQPGYAYLGALAQRNDIDWRPIQLAYEQWHESRQGLTPAGAALLAVAVSWATHGTGADLLTAATSSSAATTATTMANAAFTSLSAQAAITLVNNQGDISKTLKDLARSDTARAALAAAITTGVMANVSGLQCMQDLANGSAIIDRLAFNLINASGRALTYSTVNGGDLGDAIRNGLIGGMIDSFHGEVTRSYIKDLRDTNIADQILHKVAHAMAGCAAGTAAGKSCRDGAIGTAAAEMVAEFFMDSTPSIDATADEWDAFDNKVKTYGKLVAGSVVSYLGGDPQTAITTAETAYDNNARSTARARAREQGVSVQQYYLNTRATSLLKEIIASGGRPPDRITDRNSPQKFTREEIQLYERILRDVNPNSPLLVRQPLRDASLIPDAYINWSMSVNMNHLSNRGGTTAFGFNRDRAAFFKELLKRHPQAFSDKNVGRINAGKAPTIDQQWIRHNPSHQSFTGQILVHHHWMQGNIAVPLPESIHRQWNSILHPYR